MKRFTEAISNGEKGFYLGNSVFFPFHFDLVSIWIGKEMSLLSSPEIITDLSDPATLGVREGESFTNLVFRKWSDLGRELGHHKGHIVLHAAEKGSDIFRPENLHYIQACFQHKHKDIAFNIIKDPFEL
ncbi:hypothetical protein [Chlorobium sp.]|jgi:hypothetical protein|uniref:hypothetical protein n=1 Tax=Chlorobium sp. TaxID=1095 RepID=UPI003C59B40D|nr:hypothetical protein [Chlorobiaceae bacterium]NTW93690.1 hypothetical protein [Chlorobiaceae bacterium]